MNILIDNKDLFTHFGIKFLDYTQAFGIAKEREDNQIWYNKSGIDKNLNHNRFEAREFVLEFYTKQTTLETAYLCFKNLAEYLHTKKVVVLSLHSTNIREAFLVERSMAIAPDIFIRQQNNLYYAKIGFRDINPNALVYKEILLSETTSLTIDYDKGTSANIYWGNGDKGEVSNSTAYTHATYSMSPMDQYINIIVDVDKDISTSSSLSADFIYDFPTGISSHTVQFTSSSIGTPTIYRWDFGDNEVSDLESPSHTYVNAGTFDVKLTIYNIKNTQASKTVTGCITVRKPRLIYSTNGNALIYSTPTNYIVKHN